jgi:hypothetical protein
MLLPKCPRCGNALPISAFLIKPKEKRFKIEHVPDAPKIQCGKCMAAIRTNPKVYYLVVAVWITAGIILLIGTLIGKLKLTGFMIIMLLFAGCISMLLSWHYLEVTDEGRQDQ